MADPLGPVVTGGFDVLVIQDEAGEGPALLFLPSRNNDALQRECKASVCYSMPERLRRTRNPGHNPHRFRRIHFVGGFDETTASPLGSEGAGVYGR
jgi:hypothetical protein